jgi:hypothetical protein
MKTTLLLGDYARVSDGKLDVLGAGWSMTGPGPSSIGLAVLFSVEWHETNRNHPFVIDLLDADGNTVANEAGQALFHFEAGFEAGRPAGIKAGTLQMGSVAVNLAQIPIPPGGRYEFRLVVDGDEETAVSAPFSTRRAGPPALAA